MSAKFISPARRVQGELNLPGDKSISHRAAILGLLAEGETRINNYLTAADCLHTLQACEQLGAKVKRQGTDVAIRGRGLHGLQKPAGVIDCGNSGTGTRLLAGVLAGQPFESVITGDEQVRRRPMQRIIEPLRLMGARIESEPGGLCPLRISGGRLKGIDYVSPVASAQVKSCVLLAGLFAEGTTTITLPLASRRHTEHLLDYFGVKLKTEYASLDAAPGTFTIGERVQIAERRAFSGREVRVPADISSAAFFLVAAALLPGSEIRCDHVSMDQGRQGILLALNRGERNMHADLDVQNERLDCGEGVADITVRGGRKLTGVKLAGSLIPSLIDEIPILAVAAALAEGDTEIKDAAELRAKETDRISVLAGELRKLGVDITERPDGMLIRGGGAIRGGEADSHGDHRLAMSLAVAGLVSQEGVTVYNPECVNTSFPQFWDLLESVAIR